MTALLDPPHRPTTDEPDDDDQPRCTACRDTDEDDLQPWLNGDLYCSDCRTTFADQDDQRGFAFI